MDMQTQRIRITDIHSLDAHANVPEYNVVGSIFEITEDTYQKPSSVDSTYTFFSGLRIIDCKGMYSPHTIFLGIKYEILSE